MRRICAAKQRNTAQINDRLLPFINNTESMPQTRSSRTRTRSSSQGRRPSRPLPTRQQEVASTVAKQDKPKKPAAKAAAKPLLTRRQGAASTAAEQDKPKKPAVKATAKPRKEPAASASKRPPAQKKKKPASIASKRAPKKRKKALHKSQSPCRSQPRPADASRPQTPQPQTTRRTSITFEGAPVATLPVASVRAERQSLSPLRSTASSVASEAEGEIASFASTKQRETEEDIIRAAALDEAETGDGSNSDEEGDDLNVLDDGVRERLTDDDEVEPASLVDEIKGSPTGWTPPSAPESYSRARPKECCPEWEEVDNPGEWNDFSFQPKYHRGKYEGHFLPGGATVVPKNREGKRMAGDWEAHYGDWVNDSGVLYRSGATKGNIMPPDRRGQLDAELLEKLGLTAERMQSGDALFFWQCILPICEPKLSGIEGDPRNAFYTRASRFTNGYAVLEKGYCSGYGHKFEPTSPSELLNWDGSYLRHGARGGVGSIHHRYLPSDPDYDPIIAKSMTFSRNLQLKATYKLNNNLACPVRGEEGYDPASKYDFIYDVLVSNINALTKTADLDQCLDETTWSNMGFGGEALYRVHNKPGVCKGGQTVMLFDVTRKYPRAYIHRHKLQPRPPPFTQQGTSELYSLASGIKPLIMGAEQEEGDNRRQIFSTEPHITADNHFSGDPVMGWLGENGYGGLMTCRRDRLPHDIEKKYLHHIKQQETQSQRCKVARYEKPIIFTKHVKEDAEHGKRSYSRAHVSFQSTGTTNISTVNSLNSCSLYVRTKERGRGQNKRAWGIEMNEGRDIYLNTYSQMDSTDHLIKNANLYYKTWKFWHAPMRHAKSLAAVVAYTMYLECGSGDLKPDWKVAKLMSFRDFRLKLSKQQCQYRPRFRLYPGDEKMRDATQQHKTRRQSLSSVSGNSAVSTTDYDGEVELHQLTRAISQGRCCSGNYEVLRKHLKSMHKKSNSSRCEVCGEACYWKCGLCNRPVHVLTQKGGFNGMPCFLDFHDEYCFGLAKCDSKKKKEWRPATDKEKRSHSRFIKNLKTDES